MATATSCVADFGMCGAPVLGRAGARWEEDDLREMTTLQRGAAMCVTHMSRASERGRWGRTSMDRASQEAEGHQAVSPEARGLHCGVACGVRGLVHAEHVLCH